MFPSSVVLCRKMLKLCGETQDKLAQELITFELTIERDVVEPLNDLSEVRRSSRPASARPFVPRPYFCQ